MSNKDLRMEIFASKEPVKPIEFHVYEFHTSELYENKFKLIRSAAWKIRNVNTCGVFEDGKYIYTTAKIEEKIPNADFNLVYLGEQTLEVLENKKIYSELIKYYIVENLKAVKIYERYRKYACRSSITSRWIMTEEGFQPFASKNKQINLERKYRGY